MDPDQSDGETSGRVLRGKPRKGIGKSEDNVYPMCGALFQAGSIMSDGETSGRAPRGKPKKSIGKFERQVCI